MSTNKKFRIQNGADIVGELSINDVTVIGADGKVVAGAIQDAVASLTAADIADLQSQVTAILGTSPETLDTLQEIVTAFQDADTNLVASVASNSSDIATINATLTSGVATPADVAANTAAIAAANARTAGISTSSGSSNIQMTADVDMDGNAITNMADPSSAQDAATKAYVDAASTGSSTDLSNESAARIAGDSASVSTAAADATSKADAAEASAKAYADQVVAATVDAAPAALDTLNELAAALGDDANFASTVTASIATKADDAATTAALDLKEDKTVVADLDMFVKGSPASVSLSEWNGSPNGSIHQNSHPNVVVPAGSWTFSVDFTGPDGYEAAFFIVPADRVITSSYDSYGTGALYSSGNMGSSGSISIPLNYSVDVKLVYAIVAVGGDTSSNQVYSNASIVGSPSSLDTTATQVVPAINEVHAELGALSATQSGDTSSLTSAIATAKSEAISTASADATAKADSAEADAKAYADQVVAATVDAAPAALDTLNELAAALGDDANFASTVTASIATKADDAATTAALATKEDKTVVDALDLFVKGEPTSAGPVAGAPELGKSTLSTSDFTFPNGVVRSTSGVTGVEIIRPGSEAAAIAITLEVGKTYEVSYRASTWGAMVGSNYMAIIPASVKPTGGHTFNDGYDNNLLFKHYNGQFFPGDEANFQSHHWGNEYEVVETDRIRYITPNVADLHILFWLGGGAFGLADFSIKEYSFGGSPSLDTTVSGVVPAINELHTELNALSSTQSGDVSGLQAQINAEAGRAASAEAVNAANIVSETSARSSADAALESDIIGLQNQVSTIISGSPASLDTLVEIVSAFETADASLSGVITANGGRLTTAENNITALEADLTAEESARGAGDVALQANIDAEATTRSNLGSQLLGYININGAAITAGDNANSAEIATEKSRAEGAEATLQSNIDALTSSTGGDVSGLQANIDAEASTRSSADSALQSSIDAEETRATSAEAGLQSQISNVLSNTDATALNSLAEIVAEFQSADSTLTGAVAGHGTRLTSLESSTSAILAWDTDNVSEGSTNKYWTPERTKTALSGGLCITYNSTTGEIKIDEAEVATDLHVASSSDANALGGQTPSHYRIDVYDVNGVVVN
jgi:hypothetical protein